MQPNALLQCLIGYEPVIDVKRNVIALRVRLSPTGGRSFSMGQLYGEFAAMLAPECKPVMLSSAEASIDESLLETPPHDKLWLEIPGAAACNPDNQSLLQALHKRGTPLSLGGRPPTPIAPALLPAFRMSIIHVNEDRRLWGDAEPIPSNVKRTIGYAQQGVTTLELMDRCFSRGATAVMGWPMEDAMTFAGRSIAPPDYTAIIQLLAMADDCADPPKMEEVLRRDPATAYRLMRYVNSAGFGLSVQIQSIQHAIMMLGYQKLKRWLSLLLVTSSKEMNMRPVMLASFRRGVLLEHLLGTDGDAPQRDELFILGMFSLLDKLMKKPFDELFSEMTISPVIHEALVEGGGQFAPYLKIIEMIEQGPDPRLSDRLDDSLMSLKDCNTAVLQALTTPELTEG